jgi:FkbM family methyltransferase
VIRRRPRPALPKLLRNFAEAFPDAFFVEIGANDGVQHDHLRPFVVHGNWSGIMVEPVPYVFERLRRNYEGIDRVALENAAITADGDADLPFFHLRDAPPDERAALPDWYDGVGSFSRAAILSHAGDIPDVADRVVESRVAALSFDTLLERHGAPPVDLIVIDAEGYDAEIIRSIDFERHHPKLVLYEHYHLDAETRADTRAAMETAAYATFEEGFDTVCLDRAARLRFRSRVRGVAKYEERG